MRITLTVLDPAARTRADLVLTAPPGTGAAEAAELLRAALRPGTPPAPTTVYAGQRPLPASGPLDAWRLAEGAVLSLDAPARWGRAPAGEVPLLDAPLAADGTRTVSRPPRLLGPGVAPSVRLPAPAQPRAPRPLPWLVAAVPALGSLGFAAVSRSWGFVLLGVLGPVALLGSAALDRRRDGRAAAGEAAAAAARQRAVAAEVAGLAAAEAEERRAAHPGPDELAAVAAGPGTRLWERRHDDPDALVLRVGSGGLPARLTVVAPDGEPGHPLLADVPVTLDLARAGVVGVAGPGGRRTVEQLVVTAAVLHAPRDLQVVVLSAAVGWEWVRWLPHARAGAGGRLAGGSAVLAHRIAELTALVAQRAEDDGAAPDVLVVVDAARRLRALPGLAALLRDGPAHGLRLVCLEADARALPEECAATVVADGAGLLRVAEAGRDPVDGVRVDPLPPGWAEAVARSLAPLRDATPDDEDAGLPPAARLLDVLGTRATAEDVLAGWQRTGGRSTRAVLGAGLDGPFAVDLAVDGPHALVAGTTGAGKSELLQTLVASLALANRPEELALVLVDYKGGAAFRECAALPHTVGVVTDLDGALVERALASLQAELRRREHVLAAAGARDLDDHVRRCGRGEAAGPPLGRLVIVVDEFAALVRELPEFVTGLVDVAQRGRSLGVSLVLATQRPSGAVSPEIRANASLRVALRVSDAGESTDVIDAPHAARIPRTLPGRAYARLGPGVLVPFQAGRVGGPAPGALPAPRATVTRLDEAGPTAPAAEEHAATDLAQLVSAVREAAARCGAAPPPRPWLPPLPPALAYAADGALGLLDLPELQDQQLLRLPLEPARHLAVVGSPRSGRSTTLRLLAVALADSRSPDDLHLHLLDCGGGKGLAALAALPHVGAVVGRDEPERAARLLDRLVAEVQQRQRTGVAGPRTVLLLDGWEGFDATLGELDGGRLGDLVHLLLREGPSVGVSVVVSGDRALLAGRLGSALEARLVLRLPEGSDWSLAGVPRSAVPGPGAPPGRAVAVGLGPGPPRHAQLARLTDEEARRSRGRPLRTPPWRVDPVPRRSSFAEAWALRPEAPSPAWVPLGLGGDELAALGPDLSAGVGTFVVAGPPRSGRTTALLTAAVGALRRGLGLVVLGRAPALAVLGTPATLLADPSADELATALLALPPGRGALLVDDAETYRDAACRDVLLAAVRAAAQGGPPVLAAGDAEALASGFTGWHAELRRARRGLLLCPQGLADGDLVGTRVPRSATGGPLDPGRGLLHLGDGRLVPLRVASSTGADLPVDDASGPGAARSTMHPSAPHPLARSTP
ncbi:S-DNA-T family DNA segregation ATPase FtsK/SpoIIIE [Motilibacter rhizosphaerae]|uniref:S-DNA-T family DNA segregation ATPase FtsK/SpoIIIE n=1 Tax=Motilibacter rhizosphaerae TaxID=598652 RepID=A0A4Q7NQI1_9ACTN|nr:FtsK/SpoIIIE domain-containing protein [Motilibacter rhizosphaerae]RZS87594.1 S-DNA-T family DNA segregation ATPase FtsK/SpoIIIE [Motilibacter rhizosphaerae]